MLLKVSVDLWERILKWLDGRDFIEINRSCSILHDLLQYPPLIASFFLSRYSPYAIFPRILHKFPHILNIQLIDALIEKGAFLPKYLIEKEYQKQQHFNPEVPLYAEGVLEYLVAQGYKIYCTRLNLDLASELNDAVDDYTLFLSAFNRTSPPSAVSATTLTNTGDKSNTDTPVYQNNSTKANSSHKMATNNNHTNSHIQIDIIRKVFETNHFVPLLTLEHLSDSLSEFMWMMLLELYQIDQSLGKKMILNAHFDFHVCEREILRVCFLKDLDPKKEKSSSSSKLQESEKNNFSIIQNQKEESLFLLDLLLKDGFSINEQVFTRTWTMEDTPVLNHFDPLFSRFENFLTSEQHLQYSKQLIKYLLKFANSQNILLLDLFLQKLPLKDSDIKNALYVDSIAQLTKRKKMFMTRFGKEHEGMADCLWKFMIGRYGIHHEFTKACFSDLLIGGHVDQYSFPSASNFNMVQTPNSIEFVLPVRTRLRTRTTSGINQTVLSMTKFLHSFSGHPTSSHSNYTNVTFGSSPHTSPQQPFGSIYSKSGRINNTSQSNMNRGSDSSESSITGVTTAFHNTVASTEDDENERDDKAIEAMETLFVIGQPFSPSIFGLLSQHLLRTKELVGRRYIYFMSQVEKTLLNSMVEEVTLEGLPTYEEWMTSFKEYMSDDPEWQSFADEYERTSSFWMKTTMSSSQLKKQSQLIRFFKSVLALVDLLCSLTFEKRQDQKALMMDNDHVEGEIGHGSSDSGHANSRIVDTSVIDMKLFEGNIESYTGPFEKWFQETIVERGSPFGHELKEELEDEDTNLIYRDVSGNHSSNHQTKNQPPPVTNETNSDVFKEVKSALSMESISSWKSLLRFSK